MSTITAGLFAVLILLLIGCSNTSEQANPPPSYGLGVSQERMWSAFDQPAMFPVSLRNSPLADGTPRSLGTFESGHALLEMEGPIGNLTSATLLLDDTDDGYPFRNALYMNMLLDLTMPEWTGSSTWIAIHMEAADAGEMPSTRIRGVTVTITVTESPGLLELDVRGS